MENAMLFDLPFIPNIVARVAEPRGNKVGVTSPQPAMLVASRLELTDLPGLPYVLVARTEHQATKAEVLHTPEQAVMYAMTAETARTLVMALTDILDRNGEPTTTGGARIVRQTDEEDPDVSHES